MSNIENFNSLVDFVETLKSSINNIPEGFEVTFNLGSNAIHQIIGDIESISPMAKNHTVVPFNH